MLLPEAKRRDEIRFLFARFLPYTQRLILIVAFMATGFAIQAMANIWAGTAFLFVAVLLSLVHGYSNMPQSPSEERSWGPADRKQLEDILRIGQMSKRWDQTFIDITCPQGFITLLFVAFAIGLVAYQLALNNEEWLMQVWLVDAAVLVVPHWVTGVRRVLTNAPLIIKTQLLLAVWDRWEQIKSEGESLQPQIEVRKGKAGDMPVDAKLILRPTKAPADFLGLQMQVAINNVQGSDYPYFYGVLVARRSLRILEKAHANEQDDNLGRKGVVLETDRKTDVDTVVVRQQTTRNSGYHTKPAAALAIFDVAWSLMHTVLETQTGEADTHGKKTGAQR